MEKNLEKNRILHIFLFHGAKKKRKKTDRLTKQMTLIERILKRPLESDQLELPTNGMPNGGLHELGSLEMDIITSYHLNKRILLGNPGQRFLPKIGIISANYR